jgi:hypothetical protein
MVRPGKRLSVPGATISLPPIKRKLLSLIINLINTLNLGNHEQINGNIQKDNKGLS